MAEKKTTCAEPERKHPREWAVAKGLLTLCADGAVDYRHRAPWQYMATRLQERWPDPEIEPGFAISEAEFDAAVARMMALTHS